MKPTLIGSRLVLITLLLLLKPNAPAAEMLTLIASEDTHISERFRITGVEAEMVIGTLGPFGLLAKNRGLVRFAGLSQIPADATIRRATFKLTVIKSPASPGSNFELHRLLKDWNELESTWTVRLDPDENWDVPGGAAETDFNEVVSASQFVGNAATYTFDSTPAFVADVTAWVRDPSLNFGWLIKTVDESVQKTARRIAATGGLAPAPTLEVEYDLNLSTPATISAGTIAEGQFCFNFEIKPGKTYAVERRDSLDTGGWLAFTNLPPGTVTAPVTVCDTVTSSNQFYRVKETPAPGARR